MRILFITNLYPPCDLGGWEQNCQEIVQRFTARGHVCHVLTSSYGADKETPPEECISRSLYLEADIHYYRPLDFFLRRPGQERANQNIVRRTIEQFQPDVVFVWGMWNLSHQIPYWAEQWLPGRVAYSVAGYWFMQPGPHEAYWQYPRASPRGQGTHDACTVAGIEEPGPNKGSLSPEAGAGCVCQRIRAQQAAGSQCAAA